MIYLIGGVPRSGKSTLTRHIRYKTGASFFSLDHLMRGLLRGLPSVDFGVENDRNDQEKAAKMWPVTSHMLDGMREHGLTDYIVEGVILLPKHIRQLQDAYPDVFRGCCLGYPHADIEEMTRSIRANTSTDNWMQNASDEFIEGILSNGIAQSRDIQAQCEIENVRFFDASHNFERVIEQASVYLLSSEGSV